MALQWSFPALLPPPSQEAMQTRRREKTQFHQKFGSLFFDNFDFDFNVLFEEQNEIKRLWKRNLEFVWKNKINRWNDLGKIDKIRQQESKMSKNAKNNKNKDIRSTNEWVMEEF